MFDRNFITYEFNVDRDKALPRSEYLEIIKPYLKNEKDSLKDSVVSFRRLRIFRSSKDTDENLHKYLWGDNK